MDSWQPDETQVGCVIFEEAFCLQTPSSYDICLNVCNYAPIVTQPWMQKNTVKRDENMPSNLRNSM